jgi:hypothetical protein
MSRIVRKKAPAVKVKPTKRRLSDSSTSLDLSDDHGYSGVEDISDSSDDDEDDVNAVEEDSILKESMATPPRPASHQSIESDDEEEEEEDEVEDPDDETKPEADVHGEGDGDETASWAGIVSEVEGSPGSDLYNDEGVFISEATPERHVHFDVPYSDSDSTATEDDHADIFPDIFVDQHSLDPSFRREIEEDGDDSSGSGSYWDYRGHYEQFEPEDSALMFADTPNGTTPDATPRAGSADNEVAVDWDTPTTEAVELDGYESESCLDHKT